MQQKESREDPYVALLITYIVRHFMKRKSNETKSLSYSVIFVVSKHVPSLHP